MKTRKVCLSLILVASLGLAQTLRSVRGEIHGDNTIDPGWLLVRLDLPGQGRGETTPVTHGGDFQVFNVPDGSYLLRVVNQNGDEVLSQPITVGAVNPPVILELPKSIAPRPTGETMSVARLRHRPTHSALKFAAAAQRFSGTGDIRQAAAAWEKAVAADPDFSEAHANLGTQYARLNRNPEATDEFRRAIALDPGTASYQSNLAVVLAQSGRLEEAESWARKAVRLEEANPMGHYVLGCILTSRVSSAAEAIRHLRIAAREIPRAHVVLAGVYESLGQPSLAMAERQQAQEGASGRESGPGR